MNEIEQVIETASEILDLDPTVLNADSSPDTVACWDSVGTVMLISEIEARFDVEFDVADIVECKTIGDISRLLVARVSQQ